MHQNFAESQLGEMPPSDAEDPDDEKGIPREDPNEDQVKFLKIKTIEAMIW